MAHLNIEKVSLASRNREKEEQKKALKRKIIFVLINHFLEENGCVQSADVLKRECTFSLSDYTVCDNIHLDSLLQDFDSYYFLRYQKLPQFIKKVPENEKHLLNCLKLKDIRLKSAPKRIVSDKILNLEHDDSKIHSSKECMKSCIPEFDCFNSKINANLLDPPLQMGNHSTEWQVLANLILQDVGFSDKIVQWDDIIGLERAKQILKEAIIYPLKYKELFSSSITPWKSILLYGPTGTGKTSLAAAVASESKATFFKVSVSTLTSKWRGESEKLVKVLFELAHYYSPSVIFIDEVDSLMSQRGTDHEASRRMKTEFFNQIDSVISGNKNVFILGATNMPWELDSAILRRMEKRLLVPLPNLQNRANLFKKFLPPSVKLSEKITLKTELSYNELASSTENYSAADIELVCKEAKMSLVRQLFHKLDDLSHDKKLPNLVKIETLKMPELLLALENTHSSVMNISKKYEDWKMKHGCE